MKMLIAFTAFAITAILSLAPIHNVSGLTFFNPEADACRDQLIMSNECKQAICEEENVLRNWPSVTYYEDCSKYDSFVHHDILKYGAGLFTIAVLAGGVLFWKKRRSS